MLFRRHRPGSAATFAVGLAAKLFLVRRPVGGHVLGVAVVLLELDAALASAASRVLAVKLGIKRQDPARATLGALSVALRHNVRVDHTTASHHPAALAFNHTVALARPSIQLK